MTNVNEYGQVAVTGGKGLLGSTLVRVLGTRPLSADIRDAQAVLAEIEACKPRWIIHTAAKTDVGQCECDPKGTRAVNVGGTKNVVNAAREVGARVLYISSVSVFFGREGDYREDALPQPVNVYNITKREGEIATLAYEKGVVLRLNLIGVHPDGPRGKNFMEWLVNSIRADKDLTLFNDQFINPLSNWTVAALIKTIIEKDIHEKILHIGSSDVLSKAAIGKLVLERFSDYRGNVKEKSIDSIADGVTRPKQMWLNTDQATTILGPMPTIEQELKTLFQKPPFEDQ